MKGVEIIRSSTRTPSTLLSSGLHPVTTTSGLSPTAGELFATVVKASTTKVSLDRGASSRLFSTRSRRSLWARVQDALSVEGVAATRGAAAQPQPVADTLDAPVEPLPTAATAGGLGDEAPGPAVARQNSETARVELTIDSLRNYELVKPIRVLVESLGERHYVAEVPDLILLLRPAT